MCHRDLKPTNILATKDLSRVVIVDFNVAKKSENLMYTRQAGSLAFAAPERLLENSAYTNKVDMWACGVVLYVLLVGEHPFESEGSLVRLF